MSHPIRRKSMLHTDPEGFRAKRLDPPALGHERYVKYEAPRLDADAICTTLNCHQSFECQAGYVIHDLPCYGAFAFYGDITEAEELALCRRDALRLVRIANTDSAVVLEGTEDIFGPATQEGYLRLHRLGRKLIRSFNICRHDATVVETENVGSDHSYMYVTCADIQSQLLSNFDISTGEERFTGSRETADNADERRFYHAVVNYMTAILVRIILQTIRGEYWVNHLVAVVARLTAKVKVIGTDLPRSVDLSLQKSTAARIRIHQRAARDGRYAITRPAWYGGDEAIIKNRIHPQVGEAKKYLTEMHMVYETMIGILIRSVSNFAVSNALSPATDDFESSVAMYESFITAEQVLLCQERDGGIGAASEGGTIRAFTGGFQVCLQAWETLLNKPVDSTTTSWTSIQWKWSPVDEATGALLPQNRQGAVKLTSMQGAIAATVPYSLITGPSTAAFSVLTDMILFGAGGYHKSSLFLIKQPNVLCTAVVRTSTYESRRPDTVDESDACPVSETFLLRKRAVVNASTGLNLKNTALAPIPGRRRRENEITLRDRDTTKKALESVLEKFNTWVLDNNVIIVPYKKYAWGSMAISALLVLGGLVVGFVVGERINGVDPFNISMFCWALAAFLLLVAKAIRVEYWPWSTFLRGQCPCRSVNEVVAVTGVDPQVLLAILLRLDNRIYLRTRGPFNCFFRRRSEDAGGFSIDVPIRCATAIEGGLIPIKVLTDWGPRLVFVYTHSWANYNVAEHSSSHSGRVFCRDITHPSSWEDDLPCYRLSVMDKDEKVLTARVLGVFEQDCYFC